MDKRAAGQYLDSLFGKRTGYAAVAYKDKGESWQEQTFAWPKDRTKLLKWAEIHADANIFICPALRKSPIRNKGDMLPTRWLWADVDMDKVPVERRTEVSDRIDELGSIVVASGTGDNRHVYVQLTEPVDLAEHFRLNAGLKDYFYADAKHADNSLLRLPGTTNWKTEVGSPVEVYRADNDTICTVDHLMSKRAFQKARKDVEVSSVAWEVAETEGLPRRIKAMTQMSSAEAIARYGSRHKAVWAVAGELHKRGLEPDQIHTLMDAFPPALDKNDDEHNGYDVHRDVEKRLIWDRANEVNEEPDEDEGFELATEQDDLEEFEREVDLLAHAELRRMAARRRAKEIEAERSWVAPPADVSWSLSGVLNDPPEPSQYLIGPPSDGSRGLAGVKHNVIITAQFKTGKTKFVIATIAKSLADGEDFLGVAPVPHEGTVVGHWNCEMDPSEMAADYVIPAGIENTDNLHGADLRGYRVNILSAQGRQWAIDWLVSRNVKVWTIDSLARLARMAGVSEKDNDEMFDLLMALDEIKIAAGVNVVFLITHTGREKHDEGKERARGATAIDDWCDARWIMTEESGVRFLAVDGRGVGMETSSLNYDEETGRSTLGGMSKTQSHAHGWEQVAMEIVNSMGPDRPLSESVLAKKLIERARAASKRLGKETAKRHIIEAAENGFIVRKHEKGARGPMVWNHYPVVKPEGDRRRRGTPQVVDLSVVKLGRRRPALQ
jgi:hypothetical protein